MHVYMYSSLYTCNCTVLYSSFFSENKMLTCRVYQIENIYLAEYLLIVAFVSFQKGIEQFSV